MTCKIFNTSVQLKIELLLAAIALTLQSYGQSDFSAELRKVTTPFHDKASMDDFRDLNPLKESIQGKTIIGLGEATHGTHEFFANKQRLIEFMVTKLGFKTIVLEADFAGTNTINNYVLTGEGDPYNGMLDLNNGVNIVQEFLELIEWAKQYNLTMPDNDKVHFYGCDMQGPKTAAKILLTYLSNKENIKPSIKQGLALISNWKFYKANKDDITNYKITLEELKKVSFDNDDAFQSKYYQHVVETLSQYLFYYESHNNFILRDQFMAANCTWITNTIPEVKLIVWAHNGHVGKSSIVGDALTMGMHLSKTFGDRYYALGFGFGRGKLRSYDNKAGIFENYEIPLANKNSSSYFLNEASSESFFMNFNQPVMGNDVRKVLEKKMPFRSIGAVYAPESDFKNNYINISLIKMFDGIIFIKETTPSRKVQNWNPKS